MMRSAIDDEASVQERKQKLLSRNLESVFCLSISKLQGARRVSWILHGDIWILKSVQVPKSAARRVIWNLDGPRRFLETVQVLPKSGRPPPSAYRYSVSGSPGVFEPIMYFSFFLRLGNSESWKVETAITLPVLHVCTFPARERPSQLCKAPARATAWPERASLQRAPRAARHRVGARSHPRRTGCCAAH